MKNLISLATITTTVICTLTTSSAIAAIKCGPLVKDMKAQELLVSDFSYQVNKIEKKLARIESKILEKNDSINVIQSEIDNNTTNLNSNTVDDDLFRQNFVSTSEL